MPLAKNDFQPSIRLLINTQDMTRKAKLIMSDMCHSRVSVGARSRVLQSLDGAHLQKQITKQVSKVSSRLFWYNKS